MTDETEKEFQNQKKCQLCHKEFETSKEKHRHHDHNTRGPNYLGALCRVCNMKCISHRQQLPTMAFNMSYDMGLILKDADTQSFPARKTNIITKAGLHFLRVDLGNIRFLDARAFIGGSLSQLAEEYISSGEALPVTKELISHLPPHAHDLLLCGKQFFPYEYVTSFDKLNTPRLPNIEHFLQLSSGKWCE